MVTAEVRAVLTPNQYVRILRLRPRSPFHYQAGQHVLVGREGGPRRCYSMANAPGGEGDIQLHIRRWPGGAFSSTLLDTIRPGQALELSGPFGSFVYPDGDGPVVMLATGTGIAPFCAMLEAHLPTSSGRPITLYWGGRRIDDFYLALRLKRWQSEYPNFRFVPVLSSGHQGYVQDVAERDIDISDVAWTSILACGTPKMVEAAYKRFVTEAMIPTAAFLSDPFEAADGESSGIAPASSAQTIRLSVCDTILDAVPTQVTLLTALKAAGQPVLSVCGGKASCGTCRVQIEPPWQERVGQPSVTERNLLNCMAEAEPGDRLACQILLTPGLDGLAIRLPVSA